MSELGRPIRSRSAPPSAASSRPGSASSPDPSYSLERLADEMASTNHAIAGIHDLSEILAALADRAKGLVGADFAAVSTFDDRGQLTRFVYSGIDDNLARRLGNPPGGRGLLGELARRDRPLRLDELQLNAAFTGWPAGHPDMCAFLGVPVRALDRTIGSLYMTRVRGSSPFSESDEAAASIMSLQIATTVAVALVRQTQGRFARFQEREQVAHDLHDGTIQALYALGLEADVGAQNAGAAETREVLTVVVGQVNRIIRDVRAYIAMLEAEAPTSAPALVADLSFVIRQVVPDGIDVVTNINAPAMHELGPQDVEDLIYIAREALRNAVRHGSPTRVAVDLRQTAGHTALTVQDNGGGFDTDGAPIGMGTITSRTRAERLGAELAVVSVRGMGTTVRVLVPRFRDEP